MNSRPLLTSLVLASSIGAADAAILLFEDTFNRANSGAGLNNNTIKGPIDASFDGITNNTGTTFTVNAGATAGAADNVYSRPFNLPPSPDLPAGGGAGILNNELVFASGPGTTNAFVNHNFTNASMLNGFTVTISLTSIFESANVGFGGGFGLGMSLAEAQSTRDAISNNGFPTMQSGLGATNTAAVSDFWLVLRANGSLQWGGRDGTGKTTVSTGISKTGTISAVFSAFDDFDAETEVGFEVFYNGDSQGTGTFAWSEDNANYIGLDARSGEYVTFDNFSVVAVPEPGAALLGSLGILGLLRRRR